jgi:fucose permease
LRNRRLIPTSAYYLAFIGLGLVAAVLGPTIPALAELTRTSISQISILFAARALGYLLGSVFGGYLYDRVPGHPLMALTLVGLAITLVITPVTPLLWVLVVVLCITGLSQGLLDVGGNTLIVWVHGSGVGPYMNGLHLFYGIGTFLAPIIIAQAVILNGEITWGYWLIAALLLLPALQLFFVPSQPNPAAESEGASIRVHHLLVFLAAAFLFCYSSMANIFGGWIYSYAVGLGLADAAAAAYLTSTFWGALTFGRLISIPIAVRFKPSAILYGDLLGCVLSVGVVLLWPHSPISIWVGAAGLGLSVASLYPTTVTLVERRVNITGKVTSRFVIGSALGAMIPPWLVGQLFDVVGPPSVIYGVLFFLVIAIVVYRLMRREMEAVKLMN